MRRIQIVFLMLAALLLVPMGLLLRDALESVAFERGVRHRTVAERVFDEMERELSALLQREEERPFGHYRFFYVPETVARGHYAVARSPISELPQEPYILGYFQVDPDGSFHSPLIPRDPSIARASGDWRYSPRIDRVVGRLANLVRQHVPPPSERLASERLARRGRRRPAPSDTGRPVTAQGELEAASADALRPPEGVDVFEALRGLNRGVDARLEHRRFAVRVSRRGATASIQFRALDADEEGAQEGSTLLQWTLPLDAPPGVPDDGAVWARHFDVDPVLQGDAPPGSDVAIYPMVGRALDGTHLLLYRDGRLDGRSHLQGLILDFSALTHWLDDAVLAGTELALRSHRQFSLGSPPRDAGSGSSLTYQHVFAEPFRDLSLRIALEPLPDVGGTPYLYVIAALLVVAGVAGLFALYHMVAVTVRFAERRSNFAAAVSHELKTPLTAIRMHAEMLRDGMVSSEDKRREYLATITAESERLTRLINNVLEFSRLEQGTREMNLQSGPIGPVVHDAARILEPHASEAGFRIEVAIEDGLPSVRFDRDAVVQVVFNLVDNALKYARSSSPPVIRLHCRREGNDVRLSVRDQGPGVSSRHLGKIFEPFYRGEDELTRTARGTGIGLALVKSLAERMGAAVSSRNASGGGFEVSLTFRSVAPA